MCFNRRRNIFTLGDFYQRTRPVSQVRGTLKNREKADVFERDPFKVQSYNFRYAERPGTQQIPPPCTPCRYHNHLHALKEAQPLYIYSNGMSNTGSNENADKANKLHDFQRCKCTASEGRNPIQRLFTKSSQTSTVCGLQQSADATSRINETDAYAFTELSTYGCRDGATGSNTRRTTTINQSSPFKRQFSNNAENVTNGINGINGNGNKRTSTISSFPENGDRLANFSAAVRARLYARETSKAMAAAVGTVGCPSTVDTTKNHITSTTKTNIHCCPKSVSANLSSMDNQAFGCRRSTADTEIGGFNTNSTTRTDRVQSNTMLRKNGIQSTPQGYRLGTMCGNNEALQKSAIRNMVNHTIYTQQQPSQNGNICITIKGAQQEKPNENLVIKIESAAPIKITKSSSTCNCAAHNRRDEPATQCGNRWNNLTTQKTKTHAPRGCNITSKSSAAAININRRQSKCSVSDDDNSLHERVRVCELFFEREEKRLQELAEKAAKLNNVGHVLGRGTAKENVLPQRNSYAQPRQQAAQNTSNNGLNSKAKVCRLQSIYENGLTSLRQLRASIENTSMRPTAAKPPGRTPSVQSKLSARSARNARDDDHISRKTSTTTFTMPRPNNSRSYRSISQISLLSDGSNRSRHSNATRQESATRCHKASKGKPRPQMNVNINLFSERRNRAI